VTSQLALCDQNSIYTDLEPSCIVEQKRRHLERNGLRGWGWKRDTPLDKSRAPLPYVSKFRGCCYTPQKNEGDYFGVGHKSNLAPQMANTDKHLAMSIREGGRPKNWEMRLVLITSSFCRSWIILSDYQIVSQSIRHKGHLECEPLPWCVPSKFFVGAPISCYNN